MQGRDNFNRWLLAAASAGALVGSGAGAMRLGSPDEPAPDESGAELVGSTNWRNNFQLAKPDMEASPLPTRQLKRMAARGLARAVSSVQRIEERKAKKLAHKRARAVAAHEANVQSTKSGSTE